MKRHDHVLKELGTCTSENCAKGTVQAYREPERVVEITSVTAMREGGGHLTLNRRPYLVENTFQKKATDSAYKGPGVGESIHILRKRVDTWDG